MVPSTHSVDLAPTFCHPLPIPGLVHQLLLLSPRAGSSQSVFTVLVSLYVLRAQPRVLLVLELVFWLLCLAK